MPDRRRRHQEPGRRHHRAPHPRPPVRGPRHRARPHVPAQRRREHGLHEHARARAAGVEEDLEDPVRHQPDRQRHRAPTTCTSARPTTSPWLEDRKWAYIRLEGRNFGDVPLNVELKLEVWDSPNSAGVIIDAVRCAKLGLGPRHRRPAARPVGLLHEVARPCSTATRRPARWWRRSPQASSGPATSDTSPAGGSRESPAVARPGPGRTRRWSAVPFPADAAEVTRLRRLMFESMGLDCDAVDWEPACIAVLRGALRRRADVVGVVADAPDAATGPTAPTVAGAGRLRRDRAVSRDDPVAPIAAAARPPTSAPSRPIPAGAAGAWPPRSWTPCSTVARAAGTDNVDLPRHRRGPPALRAARLPRAPGQPGAAPGPHDPPRPGPATAH